MKVRRFIVLLIVFVRKMLRKLGEELRDEDNIP